MKKISFEIPDMDERGVSPVIGVILMVAITVILAAVIASFVLGFGGSVQENVNAGVDVASEQGAPGSVSATWISEGTAKEINVTIKDASGTVQVDGAKLTSVGEEMSWKEDTDLGVSSPSNKSDFTVIVTAIGESGTKTVVQRKEVTI